MFKKKEEVILDDFVGKVTGMSKLDRGIYEFRLNTLVKTIDLTERSISNELDNSMIDDVSLENFATYKDDRISYVTFLNKVIERFKDNNLVQKNENGKIYLYNM